MGKKLALVFGVVFALVGVLGLLGGFGIVGPSGIFMTDSLHDWVHLISGIVFLIVALAAPMHSSIVMKVFGVVYLLVAVLGFFGSPVLGFLVVNMADNILHLVLGAVILWAGFASKRGGMMQM
jgi:hypothetical protein